MTRTTAVTPSRLPATRGDGPSARARILAVLAPVMMLAAGCAATAPDTAYREIGQSEVGGGGAASPDPVQPESAASERPAAEGPVPVPGAIPVRPATPAPAPVNPAPRLLTVEGTTINMKIVEVGVSPDGAMAIPEPFNEAGWYRYGPAPGAAAGTAVIAAHVDTTSESAPFSQLKSLTPGTTVTVQREGAAHLDYKVARVELMAKDAFDGGAVFRRDGPPELKLVTCGGRWLDEVQNYGDNVIVTAVLP